MFIKIGKRLEGSSTALATVKERHKIVLGGNTETPATIFICHNSKGVLFKEFGQI